MFAYCENNPVIGVDYNGEVFETIFDVVSLGASVVEVALNPGDPWAWAGLIGDAVDLMPFVAGVGEATRAVKVAKKATSSTDDVGKAAEQTYKAADTASKLRKVTGSYEIMYQSGKNYVGKGGFKRAIASAQQHAKPNPLNNFFGDRVISIRWQSATNKRSAFLSEYLMQLKQGVNNRNTYNIRWSPGRKY